MQIPRKENIKANKLSKLDLFDPKTIVGILVEHMDQCSIVDELEVMVIDAPDW